jgi:hypothetical protein
MIVYPNNLFFSKGISIVKQFWQQESLNNGILALQLNKRTRKIQQTK